MADISAGRIVITAEMDHSKMDDGAKAVDEKLRKLENRVAEAKDNLKGLAEEFSKAKMTGNTADMDEIQKAYRSTSEELSHMIAELEAYKKEQQSIGDVANESGEKHQSFRQRLKEVKQSLYELEEAGQQGSEAYRQLAMEAGQLEDQMADVNAMTKHLASDTMALDEVMGAATFGSGVFSAAEGAMEAFGIATGDVEEAQRKLQAAMSLTQGLQAVQNSLQKQSAFMLGVQRVQELALAKAKQMEAKGTIAATIAQKAFNAAAKANPYVLLVAALVAVVAVMVKMSAESKKAEKQMEGLNEEMKKLESNMNSINNEGDFLARMADAAGESAQKVRELRVEYARLAYDEAVRAHDAVRDAAAEITNAKKRKEAQEKVAEAMQKEEEAWRAYNKAVQDSIIDDRKEATERQKNAQAKADERRKEREREIKEAQDKQKQLLAIEKEAVEDERQMRRSIDTSNIVDERERELQQITDEADEAVRKLQEKITNAEDGTSEKTLQAWMNQQQMIREEARRKRKAKEDQWAREDKEAEQKRLTEEKEHNIESLNTYKETLDLRIQAAKEGSQEELELMYAKLEIERQIAIAEDELKTGGQNVDEINKKFNKLSAELTKNNNVTAKYVKTVKEINAEVSKLGSNLTSLGDAIGNDNIGSLGSAFSGISDTMNAIVDGFENGGWVQAITDGASAMSQQLITAMTAMIKAMEDAKTRADDIMRSYEESMYRISLRMQESETSIFNTKDLFNIQASWDAAKKAKSEYDKMVAYISSDTEYISSRQWQGSLMFGGWQNIMSSLGQFEGLFNEDGSLNPEALRALMDSGAFDIDTNNADTREQVEAFKSQIQQILDAYDAYKEAMQEWRNSISDIFGYMGDDAINAIVDSIQNGTNAWNSFKDAGVSAMETIIKKATYEKYLATAFDEFQTQLDAATDSGLDPEEQAARYADVTSSFMSTFEDTLNMANTMAQGMTDAMREAGFNVFSNSDSSVSGAVKTITEQSANVIAGQMNAIRVQQVDANSIMRQQLQTVNAIKQDTSYLKSIDQRLSHIEGEQVYQARIR